jgi:hypothetical protein
VTQYEPRHDTQFEPRTWSSGLDCNMAAAADVARFYSLGLIDHGHDYFRTLSGDTVGGTNIDQAHFVLEKAGVPVHALFDAADGKGWTDVAHELDAGYMVIAHGDYGTVPVAMRGPISRTFTGLHSVAFGRITTIDRESVVRVGDGLADPWVWWPVSVASAYMRDFPGNGFTYLVVAPRHLCARVRVANVRPEASRAHARFATITPTTRVHMGGTVKGESIGGNAVWYRVWAKGRIGYVHSSVGKVVA